MAIEPRVIRAFEQLLKKEIQLYTDYLHLLKEERSFISRFDAEKLSRITEQRDLLAYAMKEANGQRMELMKEFPDYKGKRLSTLIEVHCDRQERERLLPLTKQLRSLLGQVQRKSREFSSVLGFAMKLTDGLVSIFWSATQHINRSYNRAGSVQEKLQPSGARTAAVLKQA